MNAIRKLLAAFRISQAIRVAPNELVTFDPPTGRIDTVRENTVYKAQQAAEWTADIEQHNRWTTVAWAVHVATEFANVLTRDGAIETCLSRLTAEERASVDIVSSGNPEMAGLMAVWVQVENAIQRRARTADLPNTRKAPLHAKLTPEEFDIARRASALAGAVDRWEQSCKPKLEFTDQDLHWAANNDPAIVEVLKAKMKQLREEVGVGAGADR